MPTQGPPNTLGHFLMHVGKCVRLWESPSPRCADARHGVLAGVHTLYSLYIASTWSTRRYTRPAEALHLYSPLQPSAALYISTSLHPLQYTSLYITPQLWRRAGAPPAACKAWIRIDRYPDIWVTEPISPLSVSTR